MCDWMDGDFVSLVPQFVDHGIISVFMRDIKGSMNGTAIRIFVGRWEDPLLVQLPVVIIDSIVKGDVNELRNFFGVETTRDKGSIHWTKAVGQGAIGVITRGSSIWIVLWVTPAFVTFVKAIWNSYFKLWCACLRASLLGNATQSGKRKRKNKTFWFRILSQNGSTWVTITE